MTTKKLIELLQSLDPSGEKEVMIGRPFRPEDIDWEPIETNDVYTDDNGRVKINP